MSRMNREVAHASSFNPNKENAPSLRGAQRGTKGKFATGKLKASQPFCEKKRDNDQLSNAAKPPKRKPLFDLSADKNKQKTPAEAFKSRLNWEVNPILLRNESISKALQNGSNANTQSPRIAAKAKENAAKGKENAAKPKENASTATTVKKEPVRPSLFRSKSVVAIHKQTASTARWRSVDDFRKHLPPPKNTFPSKRKTNSRSTALKQQHESQVENQKHPTAAKRINRLPSDGSGHSSQSDSKFIRYSYVVVKIDPDPHDWEIPNESKADRDPPKVVPVGASEVRDSATEVGFHSDEVVPANIADRNCAQRIMDRHQQGALTTQLDGRVTTPIDGPPPAPVMPIKVLARRTRIERKLFVEPVPQDPFPAELAYHQEYQEDLLQVELAKENHTWTLSDTFLRTHINASQRKQVVVYLIHLGTHCRYPSSVIYQTVKLFDVAMDRFQVTTARIQLTALAALWISLKRQQIYSKIPSATTVVSMAKDLYVGREDLLKQYERKILQALDFNISFADVHSLITHHILTCKLRAKISEQTAAMVHNSAAFMVDLTLLDEYFCRVPPSRVALIVVELALVLVIDCANSGIVKQKRVRYWREMFAAEPRPYGSRQEREVRTLRNTIIRGIDKSRNKRSGYDVVYKKYERSRYGRISVMLTARAKNLSWPDQ